MASILTLLVRRRPAAVFLPQSRKPSVSENVVGVSSSLLRRNARRSASSFSDSVWAIVRGRTRSPIRCRALGTDVDVHIDWMIERSHEGRCIRAGGAEHEVIERACEPHALCHRHEDIRVDVADLRMPPAGERLHGDRSRIPKPDDRLVVDLKARRGRVVAQCLSEQRGDVPEVLCALLQFHEPTHASVLRLQVATMSGQRIHTSERAVRSSSSSRSRNVAPSASASRSIRGRRLSRRSRSMAVAGGAGSVTLASRTCRADRRPPRRTRRACGRRFRCRSPRAGTHRARDRGPARWHRREESRGRPSCRSP